MFTDLKIKLYTRKDQYQLAASAIGIQKVTQVTATEESIKDGSFDFITSTDANEIILSAGVVPAN